MNDAAQEVYCRFGELAAVAPGFPSFESMRGAFTHCGKATDRRSFNAWSERNEKWRHLDCAQADEGSRMEQPFEPERCHPRTCVARTADPDAPRLAARLFIVRLHAVPSGLRSEQAGCEARLLPDHGLHGGRASPGRTAHGIEARRLASRKEGRKLKTVAPWRDKVPADCPATGQSGRPRKANIATLSRHGTKPPIFARSVVPPRDTYLDCHLPAPIRGTT